MNYEEAIRFIHSVEWQGSRPGLSRITELLSRLGHPEKGLKAVHVAGTNGKGSFWGTVNKYCSGGTALNSFVAVAFPIPAYFARICP